MTTRQHGEPSWRDRLIPRSAGGFPTEHSSPLKRSARSAPGIPIPRDVCGAIAQPFFQAQEADINAIVLDTFDGAAFAAYLASRNVAPGTVTRDYRSDFGQAETVHERLDAMIVSRDIRADTCPGVRDGIDALARISLPLSPYGPPAGTPPPPPPAPPSGDTETLTIPAGYFPDMDVTITVESNGAGSMRNLMNALVGPVRACIDSQAE